MQALNTIQQKANEDEKELTTCIHKHHMLRGNVLEQERLMTTYILALDESICHTGNDYRIEHPEDVPADVVRKAYSTGQSLRDQGKRTGKTRPGAANLMEPISDGLPCLNF